jgi:hypothetical protein
MVDCPWSGVRGVEVEVDFELEGGELFPLGDGVAVEAEKGGDGGGGVAGDEAAGGVALAGGERGKR